MTSILKAFDLRHSTAGDPGEGAPAVVLTNVTIVETSGNSRS